MIEMSAYTSKGHVREKNEDSFGMKTFGDMTLAFVCDGFGGCPMGDVASNIAMTNFMKTFEEGKYETVPDYINAAIEAANTAVWDESHKVKMFEGMGCTLSGVVLKGNFAYIFNLGDSRVYRLRGTTFEAMTEDDNMGTERLKYPELYDKDFGNDAAITKGFGIYSWVETGIMVEHLHVGDKFVVCTDGLYNMITDEAIATTLMISPTNNAAEHLVYLALKHGGRDNVTVIVLESKFVIQTEKKEGLQITTKPV